MLNVSNNYSKNINNNDNDNEEDNVHTNTKPINSALSKKMNLLTAKPLKINNNNNNNNQSSYDSNNDDNNIPSLPLSGINHINNGIEEENLHRNTILKQTITIRQDTPFPNKQIRIKLFLPYIYNDSHPQILITFINRGAKMQEIIQLIEQESKNGKLQLAGPIKQLCIADEDGDVDDDFPPMNNNQDISAMNIGNFFIDIKFKDQPLDEDDDNDHDNEDNENHNENDNRNHESIQNHNENPFQHNINQPTKEEHETIIPPMIENDKKLNQSLNKSLNHKKNMKNSQEPSLIKMESRPAPPSIIEDYKRQQQQQQQKLNKSKNSIILTNQDLNLNEQDEDIQYQEMEDENNSSNHCWNCCLCWKSKSKSKSNANINKKNENGHLNDQYISYMPPKTANENTPMLNKQSTERRKISLEMNAMNQPEQEEDVQEEQDWNNEEEIQQHQHMQHLSIQQNNNNNTRPSVDLKHHSSAISNTSSKQQYSYV